MRTNSLRFLALWAFTVLVVRGGVSVSYQGTTTTFTDEQLAALPRVELTLDDPHEKKSHRYTGFAARELIARVGAPLGEKLRGAALQLGVVIRAKDGYAVLFSLAEFDEAFSPRTLLLADRIDGQPLPEKSAPLQLIAPGDKRAARWLRMVTSFEIVTLPAAAPGKL
jgi:hypothetical protein